MPLRRLSESMERIVLYIAVPPAACAFRGRDTRPPIPPSACAGRAGEASMTSGLFAGAGGGCHAAAGRSSHVPVETHRRHRAGDLAAGDGPGAALSRAGGIHGLALDRDLRELCGAVRPRPAPPASAPPGTGFGGSSRT